MQNPLSFPARVRKAFRLYRAVSRNPNTPAIVKILPWLSIVYILWPLDILPDVLPILGQIDDVLAIPLLFIWALKLIPDDIRAEAEKDTAIDVEAHPAGPRKAAGTPV